MLVDDLIVEVRNPDLTRLGQLSADDMGDVIVVPRLNEVGSWSVALPAIVTDPLTGAATDHVLCAALRREGAGVIVTGPGGHLLSGPMTSATFEASPDDPNGTWTIEGVSDLIILDDALAYGDPTRYALNAQDAANDTRSGPAETLVLDYVRRNIGPDGVAERRLPGLAVAPSAGRGPVMQKSPRFQNLLELVQEILTGTSLVVDVVQVADHLEVRVSAVADRTSEIRFDHRNEQLTRTEYTYSAPELTNVIVAGKGEGVARTMVRRQAAPSGWTRRIERFVDQRNSDVIDELNKAGDEELADANADQTAFQVVPNVDLGLVYGIHWRVGDLVTVVVDGVEIPVPVTSAPISASPDGVFVGATVGKPAGTKWEDVVDIKQQRTERRLSRLERSL